MQWVIKFREQNTNILEYSSSITYKHHEWIGWMPETMKFGTIPNFWTSCTATDSPLRSRRIILTMMRHFLGGCEGDRCRWIVLLQWQNDSTLNWTHIFGFFFLSFAIATVDELSGRPIYFISSIHRTLTKINQIMVTSSIGRVNEQNSSIYI